MRHVFSKILVPVAFNRNSHWAVRKAAELANKFDCDLTIVHVHSPAIMSPLFSGGSFRMAFFHGMEKVLLERMEPLTQIARSVLRNDLRVNSIVRSGQWKTELKDLIITEHIDLVVIPRHNRRVSRALIRRINIARLAQQSNCPVLTVTRKFNVNHLETIVVPVHETLPYKKLTLAIYMSLETGSRIFLTGGNLANQSKSHIYLLRSYQLLSDYSKLDVQYNMQEDEDSRQETLGFARDVDAGMIVVNADQESLLRGWWNRLFGKNLSRESDIPVLTVAV